MEELYFKNREDWRKWLEENHSISEGIWLIYYKKASGKPRIKYNDAVEEALCFGWIDSKLKRVNDEYYIQYFTPRRKKSVWSKYNLERVQSLIESGLMHPAGLEKYKEAIKNPHLVYDNRNDGEPVIPEDLKKVLLENNIAYENFLNFPASARRMYIGWLNTAKRPETRTRRILRIMEFSEQNKRPGML
jgi:uncharacterized protein YdeI (YjbR/CyaY-like superfamily)